MLLNKSSEFGSTDKDVKINDLELRKLRLITKYINKENNDFQTSLF